MALVLLWLITSIYCACGCNYLSTFVVGIETGRIALDVCTVIQANSTVKQSTKYTCSSDKSRVTQYSYTKSTKCKGDRQEAHFTDAEEFNCDDKKACDYFILKKYKTKLSETKDGTVKCEQDTSSWSNQAVIYGECIHRQKRTCNKDKSYSHFTYIDDNCTNSQVIANITFAKGCNAAQDLYIINDCRDFALALIRNCWLCVFIVIVTLLLTL